MPKRLKFYINLALVGFTLGRTYAAFQRRLARGLRNQRTQSRH
jgi:hypothetical protein